MSSQTKKPIGILILAWILIVMGASEILGAVFMAVGVGPLLALLIFVPAAISLVLGLALRTFQRSAYIALLAYFGLIAVTGLLSGHWLASLVPILILLYLWKVNEAFESSDDAASLSIK